MLKYLRLTTAERATILLDYLVKRAATSRSPENLADLVGVSVAYRAYVLSLDGRPAPVIDGFTGAQRFFLGYARMWRMKVREDYLRQWLLTVQYSPTEYRTNGTVSQVAAFYDAFGVTPADGLFRAPQERVRLW